MLQIKMKKLYLILIVSLILIGTIFAVGETYLSYQDKQIYLSTSESTALQNNKITNYTIEDTQMLKNDIDTIRRCMYDSNHKLITACLFVPNSKTALSDLDILEQKAIQQKADMIINQKSINKTKIGEGKTIIVSK